MIGTNQQGNVIQGVLQVFACQMTVPFQAQKDQSPIVTLAMPPNSMELLLD